jgi:hypothetical protein
MLRLSIRITGEWRKAAALVCLLMAIPMTISIDATEPSSHVSMPESAAAYLPHGSGRHFYLTKASYIADAVTTACAAGYHMASLWEILDVSSLTYDYDHPAAYTRADSGFGPPSNWYGWVRTGQASSGVNVAGSGNCLNWSSVSATNYGTFVKLSITWETPPTEIFYWDAASFACNMTGPVWCVGNSYPVYLPLVRK